MSDKNGNLTDEELLLTVQETKRAYGELYPAWGSSGFLLELFQAVAAAQLAKVSPVYAARQEQAVAEAVKKERERIKKAFGSVFRGKGEVWFPYKPLATDEEEIDAVNEHWKEIEQALKPY